MAIVDDVCVAYQQLPFGEDVPQEPGWTMRRPVSVAKLRSDVTRVKYPAPVPI